MIHHCATTLNLKGGIQTYLQLILEQKHPNISSDIIFSLKDVNEADYDLLHIHDEWKLWEFKGGCPAVFTLHNHSAYCPSGTKNLRLRGRSCDRIMSPQGCIWGHLIDGCGSRRPHKIWKKLADTSRDLEALRKHNITAVTISHYSKNWLIKQGIPSSQVEIVHHGIDPARHQTLPLTQDIHRAQQLLFVGRIVPDKGLDWLFQALALANPQIQLNIAGEGWARPALEELAVKLGISQRITWHGWCSREKLDALFQRSFALVAPSVWPEPAGLVLLEAYAHARAVIASDIGGIPDYVANHETGFLVPPGKIESLAAAITELSQDYPKAYALGRNGYEKLNSQFSIQKHLSALEKVYEKTISNPRQAAYVAS
jgi:glycosyltransferase involved in cell wall biosynthesis